MPEPDPYRPLIGYLLAHCRRQMRIPLVTEFGEEFAMPPRRVAEVGASLMVCNEPADVVALPRRVGSTTRFDHTGRQLPVADGRGIARGFGDLPIETITISVPCSGELLLLRCYPDPPRISAATCP